MLVIKVELDSAVTGNVSTLQTLLIANTGRLPDWPEHEFAYSGFLLKPGVNLGERQISLGDLAHPPVSVRSLQRYPNGEFVPALFLLAKVLQALGYAQEPLAPPLEVK